MSRRAVHAAAWVALLVAAVMLWPQRWGGSMTYVITTGNSMAPTWHTGDLAVLRRSDDYRVGDVAAYRSNEIKRIVMHRIVKETPGGRSFKGDNNPTLDPELVAADNMVGKLVVRVPKVGLGLRWLLKPINLALAVGALFMLFADRRGTVAPALPPAVTPSAPVRSAPLVVRITALRLPQELPTADVASQAELEALAAAYGLALLRGEDADYVLHSGLVLRYARREVEPVPDPLSRRPSSAGRDWSYGRADVVHLDSRRAVS